MHFLGLSVMMRAMNKQFIRIGCLLSLAVSLGACSPDRDWQAALKRDTIDGYKNFLEHHHDSAYNTLAESRISALKEQQSWTTAQRLDSIASYQAYLASFPSGLYVKIAESRVNSLTTAANSNDTDAPPPSSVIPDRKPIALDATPSTAAVKPEVASESTNTPPPAAATAATSSSTPTPTTPPPVAPAAVAEAKPKPKAETDSKEHPVRVQVGVFSKHDGAELAQRQAQATIHGNDINFRIQEIDRGDHKLWRVDTNPLTREAAHQSCDTLHKHSVDCAIVPR